MKLPSWQRMVITLLVAVALGCLWGLCVDLAGGFKEPFSGGIGLAVFGGLAARIEVAGSLCIAVSVGYMGLLRRLK